MTPDAIKQFSAACTAAAEAMRPFVDAVIEAMNTAAEICRRVLLRWWLSLPEWFRGVIAPSPRKLARRRRIVHALATVRETTTA